MQRVGSAHWDACSAINATIRIDKKLGDGFELRLIFLGMNAVGRAHVNAQQVFDAGVGNHISHEGIIE